MPEPSNDRRRERLAVWASALCAALYAPLVFGFFGRLHHSLDLFAHFRWHLAVLLALAGLFALWSRAWSIGVVSLAMAAIAFATTQGIAGMPFSGPQRAAFQAADDSQAVYRLLHLNLRYDNPTPERVLSLIGRTHPDIVTLAEVSPMWAGKLKLIEAAYPNPLICGSDVRVGGGAILSTRPISGGRCFDRGTFAMATVNLNGRSVDAVALHLGWPWPSDQWWQIGRLAAPMAMIRSPALVAGDFNAVSWSAAVTAMAKAGGLHIVDPIGASWFYRRAPAWLRPWLGLEIDHVMVKGGIIVRSARILEDVGSDHAPVLVEFSLGRELEQGQPVQVVDDAF
ncbi:MAG: endonuclease/exonuclease/phosphatase family protein [Rhizobiales bacterium]|jgi:endonuclease/exonuclease/phosphatase (EEP) superfamily protein YafD|nr:endonuclease/exonuclease/phosphatase family protein [Hyphomicrobiales bacterium]